MANDRDYAIIIGINDYLELPKLSGPVNDAEKFKEWLLDVDGGHVPEDNCNFIEVTADLSKPILDDVEEALLSIIGDRTRQFRRLYFFFAGHGLGVNFHDSALVLPKWQVNRSRYALSSHQYWSYTISSNFFEEVFFFLDCCRDRTQRARGNDLTLDNIKEGGKGVNGVVFYAAEFGNSAREQTKLAPGELVQGFFSKALMEGLKGAAVDADGAITADSLYRFVKRKTSELSGLEDKRQVVTKQNSGDLNMDEFILKPGRPIASTQVNITFKEAGKVQIYDPHYEPLQLVDANPSERVTFSWPKGIYALRNVATNRVEYITVETGANPVEYEY